MKKTILIIGGILLIIVVAILAYVIASKDTTPQRVTETVTSLPAPSIIPSQEKPSAPEITDATSVSHTQLNVRWDYTGPRALFSVARREGTGEFTVLQQDMSDRLYVDTNVVCGLTYTYYIEAYNSSGSAFSDEASATVLACPNATHITQEMQERYENKEMTPPQKILPLSQGSDAFLRVFDIAVSQEGFSQDELVIPHGDSIQMNVTSNQKQPFDITAQGYFSKATILNGSGSISIDTPSRGIYTFSCETPCPALGKNLTIIVL